MARARFVAVVFHRREKTQVLQPTTWWLGTSNQAASAKVSMPHHPRQNRDTVDGVIVEKGLDLGIELHLGNQAVVQMVSDLDKRQEGSDLSRLRACRVPSLSSPPSGSSGITKMPRRRPTTASPE